VCASDVGFPNVRHALQEKEKAALATRSAEAREIARAKSVSVELEKFALALNSSHVVMVRSLADLQTIVQHEHRLYVSFFRQVSSGARIAATDRWNELRKAPEPTVNPVFYEDIVFGALSLNGLGLDEYGGYHITLRNLAIAHRTTFFEENPFTFCDRHKVVAGQYAPCGYRATWDARADLAVAKLHERIGPNTSMTQYPEVLCEKGGGTDADCIEAHIYLITQPRARERHSRSFAWLGNQVNISRG
jgi:hypothetical protein